MKKYKVAYKVFGERRRTVTIHASSAQQAARSVERELKREGYDVEYVEVTSKGTTTSYF